MAMEITCNVDLLWRCCLTGCRQNGLNRIERLAEIDADSHFFEDCIAFIGGKQAGFTRPAKKLQCGVPWENSL